MSKALRFLQITPKHQGFPFLYRILTIKTSSQNIENALTDSVLTSRSSKRLLGEKAPVNDFVRTVPSERCCCKENR